MTALVTCKNAENAIKNEDAIDIRISCLQRHSLVIVSDSEGLDLANFELLRDYMVTLMH